MAEDKFVEVSETGPVTVVRMVDHLERNALSPDFAQGVAERLLAAGDRPEVKVVVLAGLPDMFCRGATDTMVSEVLGGRLTPVSADQLVRAPARCAVPVVAAMRGHAFGGGLLLGLYADVVVLSERSVYSTPFLQHGFTPVEGATFAMRTRLGDLLGTEMMLTARPYQGGELRRRSAPVHVVEHDRVEPVAMEIASTVAGAPRPVLELLKRHLAAPMLDASGQAMADELDMCETALGLPNRRERVGL